MPPLITRAEARRLGEITDHAEIEALVERAWAARVERFGDATDLCSLVNAKSGGCAEDCGFCAQSRYAEADTPMHAMMEPEQMLEHARAAEAAGAHRFCMVTQGQGLSKRDFDKVLAGARLVAEHTNLKRCASVGHLSARPGAAPCKRGRASSACTTTWRRPSPTTPRSPPPSATRAACGRSTRCARPASRPAWAGSSTSASRREQRVEMAFELSKIDPTSVPINLLNPRPGTKFGDRDVMDPWEAVKWIAIFRLILPGALFRLCGGRVENLGELQPLAVKAGLNGVMMGNFLTTLGTTPEEDRGMFTELGLNVARQADNGANPRPDNRSGWLEGETPDVVDELLDGRGRRRQLDDPPVGSLDPAALPAQEHGPAAAGRGARTPSRGAAGMTDLRARLEELRDRGLLPPHAPGLGPQGPRVTWTASPSSCSARTTTSGWPTTRGCARPRPRPRCAGASARAPRGWSRGP